VTDFPDRVLEHIRQHGPSKAKDIASALRVDRSVVNHALYGALRSKVQQSKDYRWSLRARNGPTAKEREPRNGRSALFQYYLDCLSQDDDAGVRTFADSKYDLDYVEVQEWPLDGAEIAASDQLRRLVARQRRETRKKTLWLGYPVLLRHARGRSGWEGAFVEPLLIWPEDAESDELTFLAEPMINSRGLQGIASSENIMEEAASLSEDLGLDSTEGAPLDELVARLRDLRPEWPWREPLTPAPFRPAGDLRRIDETGIYNAAIVVIADRSPFTVGLERELAELQTVDDSSIARSALGVFLGEVGKTTELEGPLIEPAPLNAEQRTAVKQSLTSPLTVVTGPPGTGKSQVVTAILVNAAWRGMRVLFASKNNKAVDVVLERLNALSPRPVVLRLGTRALQEQLANHISAILSSQPTDDERHEYESLLSQLKIISENLRREDDNLNELIRLRNRVDELERNAEPYRTLLPGVALQGAAQISASELENQVQVARLSLRRSNRKDVSFFERLWWPFLRRDRERQRKIAMGDLRSKLAGMGASELGVDDESLVERAVVLLGAVRSAIAYQEALARLSDSPDPGALAATVAKETEALSKISGEVWSCWTALLPDRLNARDRTALGDYAAILRTIAKTDEEGGTVAREIWGRYYKLAAESTKALPCWAVTSLSARGRVPFVSGDFDIVVIDEASQCDIASALPLLFRAKRAVVIGDPQQLRHITRLSQQRDQALMVKHDVLDSPGPRWAYQADSLWDLAASRVDSESIVALRDHHRSHSDIINFSNEFFYGGKLRVATDYRRLKRLAGPALNWVNVVGKVSRPPNGGAVNQKEAQAVVAELRRIAIEQRFSGEIGVVTPFRAQANLIEELISKDDALAPVLASRNFISETAHAFQGDERDLIVFSPVVSEGISPGSMSFLKSQGNIFNVGITRARGSLIVVGDFVACASSSVQYLQAFTRYVKDHEGSTHLREQTRMAENGRGYPTVARPELVSDWEKVLYAALVDAGLRPIPQYDIDQYILDLALIGEGQRKLDIEVDGERYHRDWGGELVRRDQLRNLRLIEMGWDVMRFWVYQVRDDLHGCVERVLKWKATAGEPSVGLANEEPERDRA
jgi:very-short-patch-repair endonuclease